MSFGNPTALRIGMTATLAGRPYRVAGRAVMGMEEDGETYYWNEFNLVSDAGASATLVYEETEHGGQWRLFVLFEPEYAMTAADAAARRVGDRLNLDGADMRVTLVDESRVYHIEGEVPEGVEVGDVARYFNAEAGNKMVVVSWTGDEVEYYHGQDLPRGAVASAFNLPAESASRFSGASDDRSTWAESGEAQYDSLPKFFVKLAALIIGVAIVYSGYSCHGPRLRPAVTRTAAPAAPLPPGGSGRLDGRNFHIVGHRIVEIAEVGRIYERHEYQLLDDEGKPALLVCGWKPKAHDWVLYAPVELLTPLMPAQAGAKRLGDVVNVDGLDATVNELFLSTVEQSDAGTSAAAETRKGDRFFGFSAQSASTLLLACWNSDYIVYHRGKFLPAKDVIAAFNLAAEKQAGTGSR
jgi:hypothetical protein